MCGRFAIFSRPEDYLDQLDLHERVSPCSAVEYFNAYPTQNLPVVFRDVKNSLRCDLLHWGLIPSWARDDAMKFKTSNARSETAADKPSYRYAYRHQRCLVPVDGWYEWLRSGKTKQPYFHHRPDGRVIWLGGLWERWHNPVSDEPVLSFTVLTQDATGKSATIHNRMPVCIDPQKAELWLNKELQDREEIASLMAYQPESDYEIYPVTKEMNTPKFQGRECVTPLEEASDH